MIHGNFDLPYYAIIFSSVLSDRKSETYTKLNNELLGLIRNIQGYLGHDSARTDIGITVVYFRTKEAIDEWRKNHRHVYAKKLGVSDFYDAYHIRICKVEMEHGFVRQDS